MNIRVSIRTNFDNEFRYPQTFNLKGLKFTDPFIELHYRMPKPVPGNWYSVKIEFLKSGTPIPTDTQIEYFYRPSLRRIGFEVIPMSPTETIRTRSDSVNGTI